MVKQRKELRSYTVDPRAFEFLDRYGNSASQQVGDDLLALQAIIRAGEVSLAGKLSEGGGNLLCDCLNGTVIAPGDHGRLAALLLMSVEDAIRLDGLDEKWKIGGEQLAQKIRDLSVVDALALWHWVQLYWAASDSDRDVGKIFKLAKGGRDDSTS